MGKEDENTGDEGILINGGRFLKRQETAVSGHRGGALIGGGRGYTLHCNQEKDKSISVHQVLWEL